jgi:hypothetical protein
MTCTLHVAHTVYLRDQYVYQYKNRTLNKEHSPAGLHNTDKLCSLRGKSTVGSLIWRGGEVNVRWKLKFEMEG